MDLFVINRYTGNDEGKNSTQEEKKLAKVMKNIEKRKTLRMQQKLKSAGKIKITAQNQDNCIKNDVKKVNNKIAPSGEAVVKTFKETSEKLTENIQAQGEKSVQPNSEIFKILGTDKFDKKIKVKRVLPKWLLQPTIISGNLQTRLVKVKEVEGLNPDLRKKLSKFGIKKFFPVQSTVIPFILKSIIFSNVIIPQDVCVSAPTGSGKTLSFIIPILQALKDRATKAIRALVILPTQSLAIQICQAFKLYSEDLGIDIGLITGSCLLQDEQRQIITFNSVWGYRSKVDILICTAGRLVDHLKTTEGFDLTNLEYLIIDEADRVLDNVQNDWLYHLENHLRDTEPSTDTFSHSNKASILNVLNIRKRRPPQKLLFSATLSQDPEKLQKLSLFQPKLFTSVVNEDDSDAENKMEIDHNNFIGKYAMPSELTEKYIVCSLETKPLVLYKYIMDSCLTKVIVFTNSIESVHRLKILLKLLSPDLKVREVSSKLSLKTRKDLIQSFVDGSVNILVCTDSMARGMDLPSVNAVISYTAPHHLKTYIHRVGRTARAGEKGIAVTLLEPNQKEKFLSMLKEIDKTDIEMVEINSAEISLLTDKYQAALEDLKKHIEGESQSNKFKIRKEKGLVNRRIKRKIVDKESTIRKSN